MTDSQVHFSSDDTPLTSAIRVDHVGFRYGARQALQDVTFSVAPGHIFGLLGPNGGGKTTLFRILCTLLVPDTGEAWVAGINLREQPQQVRRKIGVVFQNSSIDLELTCQEILFHQGHLYGHRGGNLKERVHQLIERFGLQDRRQERSRTLSGGLRRRLELAKGLLHQPEVLLLDEPTLGLDPGVRRDFWKYLGILRDQEGVTILVTTHSMEEAERCDDLVILNEGSVVANGSPSTLKETIGGDVIVVQTEDPEELSHQIGNRFGCQPAVINSTVRLELPRGHDVASKLMENYAHLIKTVTVGRPTLEDVFIHQTGHRFWVDEQED